MNRIAYINDVLSMSQGFIKNALAYYGMFHLDPNILDDLNQELMLRVVIATANKTFDFGRGFGCIKALAHRTVCDWSRTRSIIHVPRRTKNKTYPKIVPCHDNISKPKQKNFSEVTPIESLNQSIESLNPCYKEIIKKAFGIDACLTPVSAIARESKLSRITIRCKLAKALAHIRKTMEADQYNLAV